MMTIKKFYLYSRIIFFIAVFLIPFIVTSCKNNPTSSNDNNNTRGTSTPPTNEIWMQNTTFNPKTKTISKGTEITWVNKDSFNHTVTSGTPGSPNGLFDSGVIGSGGIYKHTFNSTGTFNYYCSIHQDIMTGTVIVQ